MHGLIQRMLDSAGLGKEYKSFVIQEAWKEIMPTDIIDRTCSLGIVNSVLVIDVEDSEIEEVLDSLKNEILSHMQQKFNDTPVISVRITVRSQHRNTK